MRPPLKRESCAHDSSLVRGMEAEERSGRRGCDTRGEVRRKLTSIEWDTRVHVCPLGLRELCSQHVGSVAVLARCQWKAAVRERRERTQREPRG